MMPKITITWNGDEGVLKTNAAFFEADWVTRMDMMRDALWDIQALYNASFDEPVVSQKGGAV